MTQWLRDPHHRVHGAIGLLVLSLIGWPLTALTIAKDEPFVVLSLSWLAITFTAIDIIATTDVRREQDDDGDSSSDAAGDDRR